MSRKQATDFIASIFDKMEKGKGKNAERLRKELESMTEAQFAEFADQIKNRQEYFTFIAPVGQRPVLDKKHMMDVGTKELGIEWRQQLWHVDRHGNRTLTPKKALVMMLPVRRQSQRLDKKRSIPENNDVVDTMTHQPTGPSKGSAISLNQQHVMLSQALNNTTVEFIKFRGGDSKGLDAYNNSMYQKGTVSLNEIMPYAGGVRAKQNLSLFLTAMHLENEL